MNTSQHIDLGKPLSRLLDRVVRIELKKSQQLIREMPIDLKTAVK